ncbi:MAG TPA: hypothetical protein VH370_02450 [Humisphaera sp.]|jgi:hypothetical protein|nr:hypothetical protein [Humisphaera sp.]
MSTITLPDEVKRLADARAAAAGYADADQYIAALILAGAGEAISPELESHLLKSLGTPAREITDKDWDARRKRLTDLHDEGKL